MKKKNNSFYIDNYNKDKYCKLTPISEIFKNFKPKELKLKPTDLNKNLIQLINQRNKDFVKIYKKTILFEDNKVSNNLIINKNKKLKKHHYFPSDNYTNILNKICDLVNIDERTLFLNIYSKIDRNNKDFSNVYDWFVNSTYLDLGNPNFERFINNRVSLKILSDENYKKELLKFIKTFDSGIEGIKTTPDSIEAVKSNNGIIDIEVIHKGENGELKALPFYLESNGTRKMFHLFDFFMDALKNGMVLFVDELDAKLHPLLTRYIINLFHNSDTNKGNGQLIYSTHDTVNLNKETFRRDEIWFAEKDKDGISEIYALSDYILEDDKNAGKKVRNDATYNKDYLTGRYGAIPVLKEFEMNYKK